MKREEEATMKIRRLQQIQEPRAGPRKPWKDLGQTSELRGRPVAGGQKKERLHYECPVHKLASCGSSMVGRPWRRFVGSKLEREP